MFGPDDLIYRYTRAQAIADGVLVDVSTAGREAGFEFPVALTRAAWERCVAVPAGVGCQDEVGRLWDVLTMLRFAVRASKGAACGVRFGVCVRDDNGERTPPVV